MKKTPKQFNYVYYGTLEQFQSKVQNNKGIFISEATMKDELYIYIEKNKLRLGLERAAHSGGYWYLADIDESENEVHFSGIIKYIDDIERAKEEKRKETIGLIILLIIILPITIILFIFVIIRNILFGSYTKRREILLEKFMVEYMGCQSDNYKHHKRLPAIPYEEKIEMLKYEGLANNTIHLYFSKDNLKRLIICSNNVGSYTYYIEHLEMFEGMELFWSGSYGYWIGTGGNTSYFADVELIMIEIKNNLIGFEEDFTFKLKNKA